MDPQQIYDEALKARSETLAGLSRTEDRIANGRLLVFVGLVVSCGMAFVERWPTWPIGLAIGGFVFLIVWHLRLLDRVDQARRSKEYFEAGLDRLRDQWMGKGDSGLQWLAPKALFAFDLDVFGEGSLFERLCSCRTQFGRESLARWLTEHPEIQEVHGRQGAVRSLRGAWELREKLHLLGQDVASEVDPDLLRSWSETDPVQGRRLFPGLAVALTGAMILASLGWALGWWNVYPFLAVLGVQWVYRRWLGDLPGRIAGAVQEASRELNTVGTVLALFERTRFEDDWLEGLRSELNRDRASHAIADLDRLVAWLDARLNQMFAPIAVTLMWEVHFSFLMERWRQRHGAHVRRWLHMLGELETVAALAGYTFENPSSVFPEVVAEGGTFEAEALGHPLLPLDKCITNDIALGGEEQVWLVSGSNMSGKSTLLRSVGINAILALAGAPVRAASLKVSAFRIGASLKSRDSLMEGTSRFYEEIRHLGDFVKEANSGVFLFLIDEIFNGTNSHDRTQGAGALVNEFVRLGAVGMLTTHDLSLTEIGKSMDRVRNVHLEDRLVDGKLEFDYQVRDGVVERSNALELMRLVGLPV